MTNQQLILDFAQAAATLYMERLIQAGIRFGFLEKRERFILSGAIASEFEEWLKAGTIGDIVDQYRADNNTEGK